MAKSFKKQVPINLAVNIISLACNVVVGLLLIPYLVHHLGVAAYGLIPLAMIFSQYVGLITQSINSAVNRFLIIALQKEDKDEAVAIFNSSLLTLALLAVLQIPVLIYFLLNLGSLFSIPHGVHADALILFSCSFGAFLLSIISSIFSVSMYSQNRLDLMRAVEMIRIISRVAIIVSLFHFSGASLAWVGLGTFAAAGITLVATLYFWRKLTPELVIRLRSYKFSHAKSIAAMGGWMLANQVGFLLFMHTDVWLISKFIDATNAGIYAAIQQWGTLLRTLGGVLAGVVSPVVAISYAKKEHARMKSLATSAVGVLMLFMALCVSILCVFSKEILVLWLGEPFGEYSTLLILQTVHLIFNVAVLPLFSLLTVMDSVKWPGIVTVILGLINLVACYLLLNFTTLGINGVALVAAITLTLKNTVFVPLYAYKKIGIPVSRFYTKLLSVSLFFAYCLLVSLLIKTYIHPQNLTTILTSALISITCCLPVFVIWLIKSEEFFWVKKYLPQKWLTK